MPCHLDNGSCLDILSAWIGEDHVKRLQSLQDTNLLLIIQGCAVTLRVTSLGGKN
jgi:hypothetical protein